ncbi:hypothetical protein [Pseudoblastomonas halimionae]|uniref:Uncharacterized protein n=1 Tax=Alteriqipengyuania halimionae TaxID=1926630 RepID=A0A6I4U5I8_9SPHN|nr:hypothetical protein [Alteriqipengyuania halimionae]MXP09722.1 hypothetical protein [Alteriqipengyuania halimionae]
MLSKLRKNAAGHRVERGGLLTGMSRDDIEQSVLLMREYESSGQGWFWATDNHGIVT